MPYTAKVRSGLAGFLLSHPDPRLRRRLGILRRHPFPPGSRSLDSDEAWRELAARFPEVHGYVYGTSESALVYTYDPATNLLVVQLAIVDGRIVPE
jgi:hypothetical protein